MRKLLLGLLGLVLACNLVTHSGAPPTAAPPPASPASTLRAAALPPTVRAVPATPVAPPATPTYVVPTAPATPAPARASPTPCAVQLQAEDVLFHPEPVLYSGDKVSVEIITNSACAPPQDTVVTLYLDSEASAPLATRPIMSYGLGKRQEAAFTWIWDTAGRVGPQTLIAEAHAASDKLDPADPITLTVNLLPASQRPSLESQASWQQVESACCIIHYLSGTAAARDIATIQAEANQAWTADETLLGVQRTKKIDFTMLSRLLGHGGFASSSIALTYIDRNPVGNNLLTLFKHEETHILDQNWVSSRPALMAEGLAVYAAGGHFKPNENLPHRAAALLVLKQYLPLSELADNFYPAQHETGYLEGAAFITYLVDTYGWDRFKQFYQSFKSGPDRMVLEAALVANYGKGLNEMESDWLTYLRAQPVSAEEVDDLRLSIALYDALRRYQSLDDPSAYYLTAWVPDSATAVRRGITADYLRHPDSAENIALEAMLADAEHELEAGHYIRVDTLLNSVNAVLNAHNLFFDALAASYLQIVNTLEAAGYEAQSVSIDPASGDTATVTAIRDWPTLEALTLTHTADGWQVAPTNP